MNLSETDKNHAPGIGTAYRIALIYGLTSVAWIFGSDLLLKTLLSESTIERVTHLQMVKGAFFVIVTAGLIFFLTRDAILHLRKSHLALRDSENRFRRMVEWSPNGVFIQTDGFFVYVNHAMAAILGADDPDVLLGRPILDFCHPDYHAVIKQRIRLMEEQRLAVPLLEERFRKLDGSYVWVEVAAIPLDLGGKFSVQGIVRDIQARKVAEAELRNLNETLERRVTARTAELQQANEDLRTFSSILSHDLQVPLRNATRLAEELLETESAKSDPTAQNYARRIIASAARLERLIQDLFEFNQLARTEIRLRTVSPVLLLSELVGSLKREPDFADATINIREPLPWVLAHRPTLALVLQNLLSNAVKFVAAGVRPIVTIRAEADLNTVRLIVEDNGRGIEPARAVSIFEPFDQPHEDEARNIGIGIGLAIVRRGVERMGGQVGVESIPGAGSRFWIELQKDPQSP